MTMDDSKDSATSPIIAQSPPPQMPQQNSDGFSLKKAGERICEAGEYLINVVVVPFFSFSDWLSNLDALRYLDELS